ncbi:MAG TPA: YfiR family protein [Rhizomicrobium sp.]|nr:YfiR family protein [Rhizomicrobium sp.]
MAFLSAEGFLSRSPSRQIGKRAFALAALVVMVSGARADELEYAVKATYLSKFAPFVTWPPSATQKATFDLCLSGSDEVTKLAPEATDGQTVNGKPITVKLLAPGQSADGCQILYVGTSAAAQQELDSVHNKPVLTITDAATGHGIIAFVVVQHHVRFDIDNGLATTAGLSISSKLLSLANAVRPMMGDAR